jgi:hypothetical protein
MPVSYLSHFGLIIEWDTVNQFSWILTPLNDEEIWDMFTLTVVVYNYSLPWLLL